MGLNLQHSSEARRVLSEFYGDLSLLAFTADLYAPPTLARQRLMKHVAREKKIVFIDRVPEADYTPHAAVAVEVDAAPRTVMSHVLPWTGWAIAAGLAVGVGLLSQQKQRLQHVVEYKEEQVAQTMTSAEFARQALETLKDPLSQNVVLTRDEGQVPPQGRATYNAHKGSLVFVASNLEHLEPEKTYELWLLPSNGSTPIPAGTFHPDPRGNAVVIMPALPRGTATKGFGVTIEDGSGSQTPTLPIILKGATG
ncbi:MAG: anti-sigma factor [Janthinobacterium lividum]